MQIGPSIGVATRHRPPAPPLWTPAQIALELWLDAADANTVTVSGGGVSEWRDKSGNGRAMGQPTAADRPLTGARTQSGLNVLDFNGADQFLSAPSPDLDQPFDIYVVFKLDTVGGGAIRNVFGDAGTHLRTTSDGAAYSLSGGGATATGGSPNTTAHVASLTLKGAAHSSLYIDGARVIHADVGEIGLSSSNVLHIGQSVAGDLQMDGWIGEFIICPALSSANRQRMEGYLAHKWGVVLATGHPFEAAPPLRTSHAHSLLSGALPSWASVARASEGSYLDAADDRIKTAAADTARLESAGLLLEPTSTRITPHPTTPHTSWGERIALNSRDPDPTTLHGVFEDASFISSGGHWIGLSLPFSQEVAIGERVSFVAYTKQHLTNEWFIVMNADGGEAYFNTADQGYDRIFMAGINWLMQAQAMTSLGGGVWRHEASFAPTLALRTGGVSVDCMVVSAKGTNEITVLGGWIETADRPTSVILANPTGAATRAADTLNVQGAAVGALDGDTLRLTLDDGATIDVVFSSGAASYSPAAPVHVTAIEVLKT